MKEGASEQPKNLPPDSSPEIIDARKRKALDMVSKEAEGLAPMLVHVADRIMEEKPDNVIFLDKGARIFATPIWNFIHTKLSEENRESEKISDFSFINLNRERLFRDAKNPENEKEIITVVGMPDEYLEEIKEKVLPLAGKKTFIIDECFCMGINVALWQKVKRFLADIDPKTEIHFFALSNDTEQKKEEPEIDLLAKTILKHSQKEDNFEVSIGDYEAIKLFSNAYGLYGYVGDDVDEDDVPQKTVGINGIIDTWESQTEEEKKAYPKYRLERMIKTIHEMSKKAKDIVYEKMIEQDKKNK
jgi:hypothetical protein